MSLFTALFALLAFALVIWILRDSLIMFVLSMVAAFVVMNLQAIFDTAAQFTANQVYFMQLFFSAITGIGLLRSYLYSKKKEE